MRILKKKIIIRIINFLSHLSVNVQSFESVPPKSVFFAKNILSYLLSSGKILENSSRNSNPRASFPVTVRSV